MEYINIFIKSIFVDNMIFAFFLGMCSYLAVSKTVKTSAGLGIAVTFVLLITVPINWVVNKYMLAPGALAWISPKLANVDLSFLSLIMFIAVIAAIVQMGEAVSFSLGSGIGWFLAIVTIAAIREKLRYSHIPPALKGVGITFIITGLMGMAFMSFMGIKL